MRLATQYDRIHAAGAELIQLVVDDEVRCAGMAQRWGLTSTQIVSDPGGERFLQALDLYNPDERDGLALPGLLIIGPDGTEHGRYVGSDFADRVGDDDVLSALEALGLPAIEPVAWKPAAEVPADLRGFFRPKDALPYFRGNRFGALAIGFRMNDPADRAVAKQHRDMSDSIIEALEAWRPNLQS